MSNLPQCGLTSTHANLAQKQKQHMCSFNTLAKSAHVQCVKTGDISFAHFSVLIQHIIFFCVQAQSATIKAASYKQLQLGPTSLLLLWKLSASLILCSKSKLSTIAKLKLWRSFIFFEACVFECSNQGSLLIQQLLQRATGHGYRMQSMVATNQVGNISVITLQLRALWY